MSLEKIEKHYRLVVKLTKLVVEVVVIIKAHIFQHKCYR